MNKTALYESHIQLGAKMISFAGWKMPFSYSSPKEEHLNVRKHGGLFDVSHMGEIRIKGKDSLAFLETLVPSDVQSLTQGKAQYSVFCNEKGGLIDDLIIYCFAKSEDYLLCVNASTKDKDKQWLESHRNHQEVEIQDESSSWGMIAVQGPTSIKLCQEVFPSIDFYSIKKFHFEFQEGCIFSRTGYTGEEGFEIYIPWQQCADDWKRFLKKSSDFSILPIGLGARDTLRLEMAYLLSGQDFDESYSLLESGLSWVMKNPKSYIGKEALLKQKEGSQNDIQQRLKGFIMEEPLGVPRKGCPILSETGVSIGKVTSGAKSPSLEKMIGLAYIKSQEKNCLVDIRGSKVKAHIVSRPILKKENRK